MFNSYLSGKDYFCVVFIKKGDKILFPVQQEDDLIQKNCSSSFDGVSCQVFEVNSLLRYKGYGQPDMDCYHAEQKLFLLNKFKLFLKKTFWFF